LIERADLGSDLDKYHQRSFLTMIRFMRLFPHKISSFKENLRAMKTFIEKENLTTLLHKIVQNGGNTLKIEANESTIEEIIVKAKYDKCRDVFMYIELLYQLSFNQASLAIMFKNKSHIIEIFHYYTYIINEAMDRVDMYTIIHINELCTKLNITMDEPTVAIDTNNTIIDLIESIKKRHQHSNSFHIYDLVAKYSMDINIDGVILSDGNRSIFNNINGLFANRLNDINIKPTIMEDFERDYKTFFSSCKRLNANIELIPGWEEV
jgi:hypothetical protein